MQKEYQRAWDDIVEDPIKGRLEKNRLSGLTMVIDKGLGLRETHDLIEMTGPYVDYVKFGFGTAKLYPESILRHKIDLLRQHQIHVYPGGTFLEVAVLQNRWKSYMHRTQDLGFSTIEISDGTIIIEPSLRSELIAYAKSLGLQVLSEVGKKESGVHLGIAEQAEMIQQDLNDGAYKVIIEGRESGKNVGVFDENGDFRQDDIIRLMEHLEDPCCVIWEAPLKSQQEEFIKRFGANVNLGNIMAHDILSLESLRRGLRGDTLKISGMINGNIVKQA